MKYTKTNFMCKYQNSILCKQEKNEVHYICRFN